MSQDELAVFYRLTTTESTIADAVGLVKSELTENGFEVIGEYHPGGNQNLYVLAFSNKELLSLS